MNTIVIDRNVIERETEKCLDLNLSQMLVNEFIFPEVKIKVIEEDRDKVFKIKFIEGTYDFECKYYTRFEGDSIAVGFKIKYEKKKQRFSYKSLREYDLYAFDNVRGVKGYGQDISDEFRRERWKYIVKNLGHAVIAICYMIMNYEPEVVEVNGDITSSSTANNADTLKKSEHTIRPKPDGNKTYLFRDIVRYVNHKKQKEKHNITCECWGVRGHYRHYKTGKVVFIHEYEKGKKRNEIKANDKTYVWK